MLLQEKYWNNDPWRILVICILLNRTQGKTAEPVIQAFFKRWPTAEAVEKDGYEDEIFKVIGRLGLGNVRSRYLNKMSCQYAKYLRKEAGRMDLTTLRLGGVGKYAYEAWRMFVLGHRDFWPEDKELLKRMKELRQCENA